MITALISRKGGVGKTTTAVNLGGAIASVGKRVLLVDLDSQASASLSLGVGRHNLAPSVADALLGATPVAETVRSTATPGLDLLTASADLAMADEVLSQRPSKELQLRTCLRPLVTDYDFVLLDCPPALSLLGLNALAASDNFIVPVVPHYLALAGVDGLVSASRRLASRCGVRPELLGILLTLVDYRTRAGKENAALIRGRYGPSVFAMEIRTNIRLAEAPGTGRTIFEHDPASTGAKSYKLLAAEVLMRARAQQVRRTEMRRRQAMEQQRRERRGEPQPSAAILPLPAVGNATGE
jgi:chromosome partitioning protein